MAAKAGGCFPGNASVTLEGGARRSMSALRPGDRVLASANGGLVFSEVMTFLDREPDTPRLFVSLRTVAGPQLALTAAHLLFVSGRNCSEGAAPAAAQLRAAYAGATRPGQCVLVAAGGVARLSRIVEITVMTSRGAFAPLTRQGTIVVDGVVASCYAAMDSHRLAHRAFAPLRLLHRWTGSTGSAGRHGDGLHWYSRILLWLGRAVLDPGRLHPLGVAQGDVREKNILVVHRPAPDRDGLPAGLAANKKCQKQTGSTRNNRKYQQQTGCTRNKQEVPAANRKYLEQAQSTSSKQEVPGTNTKYQEQIGSSSSKQEVPAANRKFQQQTGSSSSKQEVPAANRKFQQQTGSSSNSILSTD